MATTDSPRAINPSTTRTPIEPSPTMTTWPRIRVIRCRPKALARLRLNNVLVIKANSVVARATPLMMRAMPNSRSHTD
jgi:hypothetical protein